MDSLTAFEQLAQKGATRFSSWDLALFRDYCQALMPEDSNAAPSQSVAAALAEMICEGVGQGYLSTSPPAKPTNLLEYCLRDWLLSRLKDLPAQRQLPFLADAWNLLEGLLRQPRWVNAYVMARVRELQQEPNLEAFLQRVLKPLFEPASKANWAGPFRVTLLSLRPADDEFLPGTMHLVAPTVLAIKDRRRDVRCGVVLRKQGQSELAGLFGETIALDEQPVATSPRWQGEWLTLGAQRIRLPLLGEPLHWLQIQAGFVVASAVHSQKLWIVESGTLTRPPSTKSCVRKSPAAGRWPRRTGRAFSFWVSPSTTRRSRASPRSTCCRARSR